MNFKKVPGPKSLPLIGTLYHYFPFIGSSWKFDTWHINGLLKYQQFGKIVSEEIVPGTKIVWLFDPEDIKTLFLNENKYPERRSHLALEFYRLRNDSYKNGGLIPTNGPEWFRLRSAFQKGLSNPSAVQSYLPISNAITHEWIQFLKQFNQMHDFLNLISKLFLELLCAVIFDIRLHGFSKNDSADSKSSRLLKAALTVNDCILKTDNSLHLWKYFRTPMYKKLEQGHQEIDSLSKLFLSEKASQFDRTNEPKTILESYLCNKNVDIKDILGITSDFLLAGSDTVTYTASFLLYHLATNIEKQHILFRECAKLLPEQDSEITKDVIANAKYAKAALKEALRLNPISVGVGRILTKDLILSGFLVPKGTIIVTQNQVICRLEKYFKNANSFVPERWLKDSTKYQIQHPYLSLPFGHGARSCIARRLAEQNLLVFVLKIIRNYEIYWNGGFMDCKTVHINKPDQPLSFIFKKRKY